MRPSTLATFLVGLAALPALAQGDLGGGQSNGKDMTSHFYEEFTSEELEKWKLVSPNLDVQTHGAKGTQASAEEASRARGLLDRAAREDVPNPSAEMEAEEALLEDPGALTIQAHLASSDTSSMLRFRGESRFPDGTTLTVSIRSGNVWLDQVAQATTYRNAYEGGIDFPGLLATGEYCVIARFSVDEQSDFDVRERLIDAGIVKPRIVARTTVGSRIGLPNLTERLDVQMDFLLGLDDLSKALDAWEGIDASARAREGYRMGVAFDAEAFGKDVVDLRVEIDRIRGLVRYRRELYHVPPVPRAWDAFFEISNAVVEVTDAGARAILRQFAGEGAPSPPLPDWYRPVDGSGRGADALLPEVRDRIVRLRDRLGIVETRDIERGCLLWAIAVIETTIEEAAAMKKEFLEGSGPRSSDEMKQRADAAIATFQQRRQRFREFQTKVKQIRGDRPLSEAGQNFLQASAALDLLPQLIGAQAGDGVRQAGHRPGPPGPPRPPGPPGPIEPPIEDALRELQDATEFLRKIVQPKETEEDE